MTVKEWQAAWAAATTPAAANYLRTYAASTVEIGKQRGGLICCGTTGSWHHPWCTQEPKDRTDA
jgi:hypothetical protein